MEPCDVDLHLENNVFPKKFKYKILKRRKIDSQNFECELRIALNDYDDVKEWLKLFKGNTNTEWLLRQSATCEENVLNQLYVCQNSSFGKKRKHDDDEGSKSDFNCKAAISVKIKKGGKRTYYQDDYVKKGYKGVMRICFIHSHLIDKAEVLNMARQSEETKKAFVGYFTEGMSPSEAIKYHEEILFLEGHEDLGNSRKNPPEHWVYSFYEEWTKQIENRLQLESQLTRASVFWRLQNRSTQPRLDYDNKSKNIVKLCKKGEDLNCMQIPADLHVSDEDDDDSDSENQYDSYDEDSTPPVSTNYVSVSSASHQSTVSSTPLKFHIPSNMNITPGCTLKLIKKSDGSNNSQSTNVAPLFLRIAKGSNNSQGNSVQIITTSHENPKSSVVKFLTVSANSRKYSDVELGKRVYGKNSNKIKLLPGKTFLVAKNPTEAQKIPETVPNCGNIPKLNTAHFIRSSNENNLKISNIKPVYIRIKKGTSSKDESTLVKSHEAKKEAGAEQQHILTRFQNCDEKDIIPHSKSEQTSLRNKVINCRSDVSGESAKPVLKKCVTSFVHSSLSEKKFTNGNVLNDVQNQSMKDIQNCSKQVSESLSKKFIQLSPRQKIITVTKQTILAHLGNSPIDKQIKKNGDQHKNNHFVYSEMKSYDCEQQSKSHKNINNADRLTARSITGQSSNLVSSNFIDTAQACSASSQSGSVQSIKTPISSIVQDIGMSRDVLFNSIDSVHKLSQHDTESTSISTLGHRNLLGGCNQDNSYQNSVSFEGGPVQGCPFPLPEDFNRTLLAENTAPFVGNQNGGDCQIFPLPFSKDLNNPIINKSGEVFHNQNDIDEKKYPLLLSETFCNSSDPSNSTEDSGINTISSDLSISVHDPNFSDDCDDISSSQLPADLDMSNEDSLQQIFPDLSKLEDDLNNFNFADAHKTCLCSNQTSASSNLSLINTCTNSLTESQVASSSLFDSFEDNILPFPENLKGNFEDIDILKNILKGNKFEYSRLENFFQQPENFNQKDVLEKWDSEMCRLRTLLEQNSHDQILMREANQFLERIREKVVTPSELAILFNSSCNLKSKQEKN